MQGSYSHARLEALPEDGLEPRMTCDWERQCQEIVFVSREEPAQAPERQAP